VKVKESRSFNPIYI